MYINIFTKDKMNILINIYFRLPDYKLYKFIIY